MHDAQESPDRHSSCVGGTLLLFLLFIYLVTFNVERSFLSFFFSLSSTAGSSCLFSALLTKCIEKGVFALCRCVTRRNCPPRFAALVPQKEVLDDGKVQLAAPGATHPEKLLKAAVRLRRGLLIHHVTLLP